MIYDLQKGSRDRLHPFRGGPLPLPIRWDGPMVEPTRTPRTGAKARVHRPGALPPQSQPEEMPLDILYEADALLVLNKPPGLVVHPAAGHREHTVVNALLNHCGSQL